VIFTFKFLAFIFFLLFFYYILPQKLKWVVLLIGSYVFYIVKGRIYICFIILATVLSFFVAKKIEKLSNVPKEERAISKKKRKLLVACVSCVLAGLLATFKFGPITERFSLILPIGMSYYSFQIIGYVVDVYRKEYAAEQNLFKYALFVGYFPGMIQGPINRFGKMKEQFFEEHHFSMIQIRNGLWLFLWGLFKKMVIADRACVYVSSVMGEELGDFSGSILLMSIILFVVQMYADFSGGIDMAEGISELFGITMYKNFEQPFFSRSIGEFWRRWHISLGNWVRDYVFYPLAFSKSYRDVSAKLKKMNAHLAETVPAMIVSIITFIIIGLWHEISVRYLIYGLWYGIMVGASNVIAPASDMVCNFFEVNRECMSFRAIQRIRTMIIVLIGESLCILPHASDLFLVLKKIFFEFRYYDLFFGLFEQGLSRVDFIVLCLSLQVWFVVSLLREKGHMIRAEIGGQNVWFRCLITAGIIFTIAIFGMYGPGYDAAAFIYGGI